MPIWEHFCLGKGCTGAVGVDPEGSRALAEAEDERRSRISAYVAAGTGAGTGAGSGAGGGGGQDAAAGVRGGDGAAGGAGAGRANYDHVMQIPDVAVVDAVSATEQPPSFLQTLVKMGMSTVFESITIRAFIDFKWHAYGRFMHSVMFFIYFSAYFAFSVLIQPDLKQRTRLFCCGWLLIVVAIEAYFEISVALELGWGRLSGTFFSIMDVLQRLLEVAALVTFISE